MITVQCLLEFESFEDKIRVLKLMRSFSSCMRFAYQRLLEGWERKSLKKFLQRVFLLNSRYCDDAILKAKETLNSFIERGQNPVKVIFGGRILFEKLKKNHLLAEGNFRQVSCRKLAESNFPQVSFGKLAEGKSPSGELAEGKSPKGEQGKKREKLLQKWREKRQGTAYARGDKSKKGNLNLRFLFKEGQLYLRINTGQGEYVYARVYRKVQKGRAEKDKWVWFIHSLLIGETAKEYIPYSVELKLKNDKVYAFVSFEETIPPTQVAKENGVIGIDVNASPFHIAWTEVNKDGNLKSYGKIPLHYLLDENSNRRKLLTWQVAHEIVNLAKQKGKAIVMENVKKLPRGTKGDGKAKLRKRLHQFIYKGILEKVEILAKRAGMEVAKVNPAYTSIIGKFKYCPQYLIDKDVAGALVIGRRGLGFIDELPKRYRKLLSDREFLKCSLEVLRLKKEEVKKRLQNEKNKWKRNSIKAELTKICRFIKEVKQGLVDVEAKSSESDPATRHRASGGNKPVRGSRRWERKSWRVLRAAFTFPFLGKSFARDFSPLRKVLISGDWKGVVKRPVPVPGTGTAAHFH